MTETFSDDREPGWSSAFPAPAPRPDRPAGGLLIQGIALGIVAAVVGAALWTMLVVTTGYQLGLAAIGVALLVAVAVRVGSRGLSGTAIRFSSVALTLFAMAVAEYLTVRHFVNESLAAEGAIGRVPVLIAPWDAVLVIGESLMLDPVTLLFWAIALYAAWRYSAPSDPELAAS